MVFYKNTSDHILINDKDTAKITLMEAFFEKHLTICDLGAPKYFLGIKFS